MKMVIMIFAQPTTTIDILNYRRRSTSNFRIGTGFEWAFLTVPLGFVDDEYQQDHPLWANFMTTYYKFISSKFFIYLLPLAGKSHYNLKN